MGCSGILQTDPTTALTIYTVPETSTHTATALIAATAVNDDTTGAAARAELVTFLGATASDAIRAAAAGDAANAKLLATYARGLATPGPTPDSYNVAITDRSGNANIADTSSNHTTAIPTFANGEWRASVEVECVTAGSYNVSFTNGDAVVDADFACPGPGAGLCGRFDSFRLS